ncbi:MAG: excinuclease ABC subunit UvrA [Pirellulales bacterium]
MSNASTQADTAIPNGDSVVTLGNESTQIRVRGARVHNLRDVDVDIPRDRLVVLTGLSGSGKSSLAFDTVYAEGQRQYVESLSVYARQFLAQVERPDVDLIEGLPPTLAVDQHAASHNPRSTVATVTEIYDYLRLLMARCGQSHCYQCGEPIRQRSAAQVLDDLMALGDGTKAILMAPMVRGRKGQHREVFTAIRKAGFVRVRVDGMLYDVEDVPELVPQRLHDIEAVVDRIVVREGARTRLAESIALALDHGDGTIIITHPVASDDDPDDVEWRDELVSTRYACPTCKISFEELEPRSFSFNSPYGACPDCEGLGERVAMDAELLVPDLSKSLAKDALPALEELTNKGRQHVLAELAGFAAAHGFTEKTPLARLDDDVREALFYGGDSFAGLVALFDAQFAEGSEAVRNRLDVYRVADVCPACGGARLRPEARSVRLGGMAIHEITALDVETAQTFFADLEIDADRRAVIEPVVAQIKHRLDYLAEVGIGYLTLDRRAATLSGGESQRIRLASSIGSGLVGVCYVLDEPSVGLHARDNERLIRSLRALERMGNTVVVVEHDEAMIREADHVIDLGPGAGRHGGRIVACGTADDIAACPDSITGQYLSGKKRTEVAAERRPARKAKTLSLRGASGNNLKRVDVDFPLGALTCVTGVSGSGKSTLVSDTLARAVARSLGNSAPRPAPFVGLTGTKQIDKLVVIDQSPIGRTPRSNAATYTGVFDEIRKVFTQTRQARLRGYKVGRFSFNVKGGRCEECQGQGLQKIDMTFLPDLYVPCPSCGGARFNRATLQIRYAGHSIAEVLDLSIEEATELFENHPAIHRVLSVLCDVGLGYLTLGQPSTMLSGGEAQRIKLASELARPASGRTLYILDEPTTGLHFEDVRRLLSVLHALVDRGNSVIVIEHNLDVIRSADWVIDLGPEGGAAGGEIVAAGTPEDIAAVAASGRTSHTGRCLGEGHLATVD